MNEKREPRIELHFESSYSFKDLGSVITPRRLLDKCSKENITVIGVVDYCNCLAIPQFEKLKKEMNLKDIKIIYGVHLNVKFDDLCVSTILLAKNNRGIKNLYRIVSKMNQKECSFISKEDLDMYKQDLILGISSFNVEINYDAIINYYHYVEITPLGKKEDVIKINEYCKNNDLLLIASSCPTYLEYEGDFMIKAVKDLCKKSPTQSSYDTAEELLEEFNYLDDAYEIVVQNAKRIADQVEDYNLDFDQRYMIPPIHKGTLRKEVLERANLIYIEDIPNNVMDRINYELNLIKKYDLEGTIQLIESIIHKANELGGYAMVGSYLSHSLVAYLLGLTPINPMDLHKQVNFLNNFDKYGFYFEIFIPEELRDNLRNFLGSMLNNNQAYYKSILVDLSNTSNFSKYISDNIVTDCLKKEIKEVKTKIGYLPDTYFLIPQDIDLLDISPINIHSKDYNNLESLDFSYALNKTFVTLRFRPTSDFSIIYQLEHKTNFPLDLIPLDDINVLKNSYEKVRSNNIEDYKSYIHYNMENSHMPEMKIDFDEKPNSLLELINLKNDIDINWLSKVMRYYYTSYYKTYYPKDYYEVYFDYLVEWYGYERIYNNTFLTNFAYAFKNKTIKQEIENEADGFLQLIKKIMLRMYELKLDYIIWSLYKKHCDCNK